MMKRNLKKRNRKMRLLQMMVKKTKREKKELKRMVVRNKFLKHLLLKIPKIYFQLTTGQVK
jgi:hypothetical protein